MKAGIGAVPATWLHKALYLAKAAPPVLRITQSQFVPLLGEAWVLGWYPAAELSLELLWSLGSLLTILAWQSSFPGAGLQGSVSSALREVLGLR